MQSNPKIRAAVLTALAAGAGSTAVQAQDTPTAPKKRALEEIVVTATKRQESMQDIPVSVSALQGSNLEALRIDSFDDYALYLPNVTSQGTGPGQQEIYIRGAATSQTIISLSSVQGLQPSVALYLDEQPVALQGRNLDIYATDLARVEVLPGPQGTLFGASSQAGTVRLITNKPDHSSFQAGFDTSIANTSGGEMSNSVEAYFNLPISDSLALRVAAYNDNQGGWIDHILNDPENGGWNGSTVVIDRISGGPLPDPENQTIPIPKNDQLVEQDFNDATYTGGRFGLSWLINDRWDLLVQHTQQTLDTEGVWAYDANLDGESSVNRFAPDNNEDDFGLTTWTLNGRLAMLDVVYTGGYLDRSVNSTIDYTHYTNGGLFSAYYVCSDFSDPTGTYYDQCFDPSKFYKEDTENTRTTHEFRINTPQDNRWRVTAGLFYDAQELASTGYFKIASTASPYFENVGESRSVPVEEGARVGGQPIPPEVSFVNDVTRNTDQIAVFGQAEFDITDRLTAAVGARWYEIEDDYKGATTTANVTARLRALGSQDEAALDAAGLDGAAVLAAIDSGQLDVSDLDSDGVLTQDDVILRFSLDWRMTDRILLFGNYAEGFRPPVTNRLGADAARSANPNFADFRIPVYSQTDDLENWELGFKGDFLDDTLRLNITAFYSEITDLQTSRFDPTNISFLWFADNVGDAEITGADGDFIWQPTENLTISGAFSVLDTEITRLNDELQGVAAPVGSELPYSPEFSGNIRARYGFDMPAVGDLNNLRGYVSGGIAYTGESTVGLKMNAYVIEDNLRRVYQVDGSGLQIQREADEFLGAPLGTELLGEEGVPGGRYVQEDYAIANVAFGVEQENWAVELFVDNLFDENAQLYIDTQQNTPKVVTNRPRTIGLRLSYDFL